MKAGEPAVGTFLQTADPVIVEALADVGFDLLCVDAEHGHVSLEALQSVVRAAELHGLDVVVRVRECSAADIASSLDAGVAGVLVPRVSGAAEAELAVRSARFPPEGARGFGPGRAARYGMEMESYLERAREATLVAVQIETKPGLAALDEILAVEGIDVVFVGPNDLALSLGLRDPTNAGVIEETIASILSRTRAGRRAPGIFAANVESGAKWLAAGAQLVVLGSELGFMVSGARAALQSLRAAQT
jgi:4-hydroxy-2-oxoheptanedioate aldolase